MKDRASRPANVYHYEMSRATNAGAQDQCHLVSLATMNAAMFSIRLNGNQLFYLYLLMSYPTYQYCIYIKITCTIIQA